MNEANNNQVNHTQDEQSRIVLPKEVQKRMMKFFLRTSIPRKKRLEQERLSNTTDRSES